MHYEHRACQYGHQSSSFIAYNQYCIMKKRGLFPMNEMDLKFNQIVSFLKLIQDFRNAKMLFDGLDVYLRHTFKSVPWHIN